MSATLVRPTRRTLLRSAAWSVPVVSLAAAAPAFAASPCASTGFSTMNLVSKAGSDGTTLAVASALVGGVTAGPDNLSTNNFPGGGWLELENNPEATTETNPTKYQDVTFTFSQSVTELQFTVSDIDSAGGGGGHTFWDRAAIIPTNLATFTATPVVAITAVSGAGTLSSPLRQTDYSDASSPSNAQDHQMRIAFTGSVTQITIRFWSTRNNKKAGTQAIWIGNMVYKKACS